MKTKNIIFVFTIMFLSATSGYAQFFIEGTASVHHNERNLETETLNRSHNILSFSLSPQAGYWLNDRLAIGAGVSYSYSRQNIKDIHWDMMTEIVNEDLTSILRFYVFSRYQLLRRGKWALLAECSFNIGGGSSEATWQSSNINGGSSITHETGSITTFGVNVFPLITYDLTDRISLMVRCDFLTVGFNHHIGKVKNSGIDFERKDTHSSFHFGAGSTIFNALSNISIGFIYNF